MIPFKTKVAKATGPRWVHLMVALLPAAFAAPAGAQLPEALTAQVAADRDAAQSQTRIDDIRERTQDAAGRYAQAMGDVDSLERYNNQLQTQVESQEEEIASIERQLIEIETTNREVQPLMQQMVDTLARFVELDVPFLLEERRDRVAKLKEMMDRADVTISEKFRRIVEAYQIEIEYGRTIEAYQGKVDERTVDFLRAGRVALLYQTLDGSETGYWDAGARKWVADDDYEEAIRVARRDGAPDLLTVPVPAPQEVRS